MQMHELNGKTLGIYDFFDMKYQWNFPTFCLLILLAAQRVCCSILCNGCVYVCVCVDFFL